jgi:hypothetical protein
MVKGDGLATVPSTIVARRRLGKGAASSGVAGAGRTKGPLTGALRGARPGAGADDDKAERFGVDLELAEDATRRLPLALVPTGESSLPAGDLVPLVCEPDAAPFFLSTGGLCPGGTNCRISTKHCLLKA